MSRIILPTVLKTRKPRTLARNDWSATPPASGYRDGTSILEDASFTTSDLPAAAVQYHDRALTRFSNEYSTSMNDAGSGRAYQIARDLALEVSSRVAFLRWSGNGTVLDDLAAFGQEVIDSSVTNGMITDQYNSPDGSTNYPMDDMLSAVTLAQIAYALKENGRDADAADVWTYLTDDFEPRRRNSGDHDRLTRQFTHVATRQMLYHAIMFELTSDSYYQNELQWAQSQSFIDFTFKNGNAGELVWKHGYGPSAYTVGQNNFSGGGDMAQPITYFRYTTIALEELDRMGYALNVDLGDMTHAIMTYADIGDGSDGSGQFGPDTIGGTSRFGLDPDASPDYLAYSRLSPASPWARFDTLLFNRIKDAYDNTRNWAYSNNADVSVGLMIYEIFNA